VTGIAEVYSASLIHAADYGEKGLKGFVARGYNRKRSGDIMYLFEPNWIQWGTATGTTHGTGYSYDTHVPAIFYGWGIKKGSTVNYHPVTDIAPTISALLKIKFPSACTGQPIEEVMK
ncbi:MAG TPA: alkaline phosphatase family protein, partial [Cyclobacteriaceae bacterium]|nr:alkaline phosphatase family protein [Cyclobacteriaceae bacterium]